MILRRLRRDTDCGNREINCQCSCSRQLKVRLGGSWVEPLPISEKTRMQVRLHSNLDGSSLAHAIQVPMGPLLYSLRHKMLMFPGIQSLNENLKQMKKFYICADVSHTHNNFTHTHTLTHTIPVRTLTQYNNFTHTHTQT